MSKKLLEVASEKVASWLESDTGSQADEDEDNRSGGRELPDNPIGDSVEVHEEPDEIPLHDRLYYFGDDILMSVRPGYHFRSIHREYEGEEVDLLGARPYSGIDGVLVRYVDQENRVHEASKSHFRLSGEEERKIIGEAYGGMLGGDQEPASLRDDMYTPDLSDGIAWLEGEGQARKRAPLSTVYSTKDTRELLLERIAFPTGDSWNIFDEFLEEAWLKYVEDIGEEPEIGGISRDRDFEDRVYSIETDLMDFPVRFRVEEHSGIYVMEPLDERLSQTEEMKMYNVFERLADVAGRYDIVENGSEYILEPQEA